MKLTVRLDTQAHYNVLSKHVVDKTKTNLKSSQTKNLVSYTKDKIRVPEEKKLSCKIKNTETHIAFKVVKEGVTPILEL